VTVVDASVLAKVVGNHGIDGKRPRPVMLARSATLLIDDLGTTYRLDLIDAEIGDDRRAWVTERPNLPGWPTWKGDAISRPAAVA
jgi:hypothetical protein